MVEASPAGLVIVRRRDLRFPSRRGDRWAPGRRWQPVRLAGLALLAIPVVKLFVIDTFELEQGYRVVAYFSLGFILLSGGLLYQHYSEAIKRFLFEEQAGGSA